MSHFRVIVELDVRADDTEAAWDFVDWVIGMSPAGEEAEIVGMSIKTVTDVEEVEV